MCKPPKRGWGEAGGGRECTELSVEGLDNAHKHLITIEQSADVSLSFISAVHKCQNLHYDT